MYCTISLYYIPHLALRKASHQAFRAIRLRLIITHHPRKSIRHKNRLFKKRQHRCKVIGFRQIQVTERLQSLHRFAEHFRRRCSRSSRSAPGCRFSTSLFVFRAKYAMYLDKSAFRQPSLLHDFIGQETRLARVDF